MGPSSNTVSESIEVVEGNSLLNLRFCCDDSSDVPCLFGDERCGLWGGSEAIAGEYVIDLCERHLSGQYVHEINGVQVEVMAVELRQERVKINQEWHKAWLQGCETSQTTWTEDHVICVFLLAAPF